MSQLICTENRAPHFRTDIDTLKHVHSWATCVVGEGGHVLLGTLKETQRSLLVVCKYLYNSHIKGVINFLHVSSEGRLRTQVYELEGGRLGLILRKTQIIWESN